MKRFLFQIGRFFWSWGFLKFVLWAITLIIFLYVEEDWRGARDWAATKAKWEAKGETFDLNKFTPPPIPDDENLTALPIFKLEPLSTDKADLEPLALKKAMGNLYAGKALTSRGNWMKGECSDPENIRSAVAVDYAVAFKDHPTTDPLAQFDALYPFLHDLRAGAVTRPRCRFNIDYTISPPAMRGLGLVVTPIGIARISTLDAVLALEHQRTDQALADIKINYVLLSCAGRDPSLVGSLVAIGVNALTLGAVHDGLAKHVWSDAQLVELERVWGRIDFLANAQFAFRCEAAVSITNIDYFKHSHRADIFHLLGGTDTDAPFWVSFMPPWANGWWDLNKSQMADSILRELDAVDPQKHRAYPKISRELQQQIKQSKLQSLAYAPWNAWVTVALGPLDASMMKFYVAQVYVDEARIACALERYRLAKGTYPDSLDALAPSYIDQLPHDIMNGEPYHYRVRPDGTFQLYSVGWNQIDEGGKIVLQSTNPKVIDYENGDWVWTTTKASP